MLPVLFISSCKSTSTRTERNRTNDQALAFDYDKMWREVVIDNWIFDIKNSIIPKFKSDTKVPDYFKKSEKVTKSLRSIVDLLTNYEKDETKIPSEDDLKLFAFLRDYLRKILDPKKHELKKHSTGLKWMTSSLRSDFIKDDFESALEYLHDKLKLAKTCEGTKNVSDVLALLADTTYQNTGEYLINAEGASKSLKDKESGTLLSPKNTLDPLSAVFSEQHILPEELKESTINQNRLTDPLAHKGPKLAEDLKTIIKQTINETQVNDPLYKKFKTILSPLEKKFKQFIIFGDSLSDTGRMRSKLSMKTLIQKILNEAGTGLTSSGVFSNGHNWISYIYSLYLKEKSGGQHNTFVENILNKSNPVELYGETTGTPIFLNYAEGGSSLAKGDGGIGEFLKNSTSQWSEFQKDSSNRELVHQNKNEVMIFMMLGANDFITIHDKGRLDIALQLLEVANDNIKKFINEGFSNITIAIMPDISLSPSLQSRDSIVQIEQSKLVRYVNEGLKKIQSDLKSDKIKLKLFDFNEQFITYISNAKNELRLRCLALDKQKNKVSNVNSTEIKLGGDMNALKEKCFTTSTKKDEKDFIFWDSSHPTENFYIAIAQALLDAIAKDYQAGNL